MSPDLAAQESATALKKTKRGIHVLLRELSDDEDNATDPRHGVLEDPDRPWFRHYAAYMDTTEQVPDGWSAIKWWGVSGCT